MAQQSTRIEDYAFIGDTQTGALVSRDGCVDWLCFPRFDSGACFASLLGTRDNGHWRFWPKEEIDRTSRRYRGDALILETEIETKEGAVRLIDFMPPRGQNPDLIRIVEGIRGQVVMQMELIIRFDYGRTIPWVRTGHGGLEALAGPNGLILRTPVKTRGEDLTTVAEFTVKKGDRVPFVLTWFASHSRPPKKVTPDHALRDTERYWKKWAKRCHRKTPWDDAVVRSLVVLKGLTYGPTGGIVAAATTSLPEEIGGVRNWDYRYCWLRDASFTVAALDDCGFTTEGGAFVHWILYATRLTHPRLQILYDVFGEPRIREKTLKFEGYRGSAPVRAGNGARNQLQLDVYGEVLGAVEEHLEKEEHPEFSRDVKTLLVRLADRIAKKWPEPDNGIWEKRAERTQHVHGKVMAWVALDCALRLVEKKFIPGDRVDAWRSAKEEIHRVVMEQGFNENLQSFVSIFGSDELDSSLLYIARVGFLEPDDPRMLGTIEAIRKRLGRDDLLYRYEMRTDDGLPPGEGAFLTCSFWLVEALALGGRLPEARELFEKLLKRCNDVGLYSEEIDVESGALLGNFPQALTHIGMMNAALCLDMKISGRSQRKAGVR